MAPMAARGVFSFLLLRDALSERAVCTDLSCKAPYSPTLPIDDHRLLKRLTASGDSPVAEQVHLIGGPPTKVGVVWAGSDEATGAGIEYCVLDSGISQYDPQPCDNVFLGTTFAFWPAGRPWTYSAEDGSKHKGCPDYSHGLDCFYDSPTFYAAELSGLEPGETYLYRIAGEEAWRRFRLPPAVGQPIDFGVVADLGQTNNSAATMKSMAEKVNDGSIDTILFPGDLSYADGVGSRWDSFGRLAEPLFSSAVTSYSGGNHEVDTGMENWIHFTNRYPELFLSEDSSSNHHLYYSFEAGLAHVVTLCSYCPAGEGSSQRKWLEKDLASVDRARTPWVLMQWHTPWYSSNGHHDMKEGTDMREALEDIIHQAGADIVFNGHVHAYERTSPIYKNETASCGGTVYITVGDGGNREEFATPWVTPETPAPPLYDQPEWSIRREFAYGHGSFRLYNATHAEWFWFQNGETHAEASDSYMLRKAPCTASETVV